MDKIFSNPINFNEISSKQLFDTCKKMINKNQGVLINNFPIDPLEYVRFLEQFGHICDNYGYDSDSPAYSLNSKLNRVKYNSNSSNNFQEVSANLPVHSARAWGHPRPKYFSMLMVNSGWTDGEKWENGESIFVKWSNVLIEIKKQFPRRFMHDLKVLTNTVFPFKPSIAKAPHSNLPLLYPLENSLHEYDLGCRISLEIFKKLTELKDSLANYVDFSDAINRFYKIANSNDCIFVHQLKSGDVILIDNNRIGHGRKSFRPVSIKTELKEINPREVWSAVIE